MKSKRILSVIVIVLLLGTMIATFTSCGKLLKGDKPLVVTTIYPYYLITKELAGNQFNVEYLLPKNASPHTYSLTPKDVKKMDEAVLIISNGLTLEPNLGDKLKSMKEKNVEAKHFVNQVLIQSDKEIAMINHDADDHDHEGGNPHLWLHPQMAKEIIRGIAQELRNRQTDENKKSEINDRMVLLIARMDSVTTIIQREASAVPNKNVIMFHDAYSYFNNYFGIHTVAMIEPVANKEPTLKEIQALGEIIKKNKVKAVFKEPQMSDKYVKILSDEYSLTPIEIDPIGFTYHVDTFDAFYLKTWEVIKKACND